MIIIEKDGKRYEVVDKTLKLAIETALDYPDSTVEIPEGVSNSDWQAVQEGKVTLKQVLKLNEAMEELKEDLNEKGIEK